MITRCSNIYGARTMSCCSHATTALYYFHILFNKLSVMDRHPMITKRMSCIKNIGKKVSDWKKLTDEERDSIIDQILLQCENDGELELNWNESDDEQCWEDDNIFREMQSDSDF